MPFIDLIHTNQNTAFEYDAGRFEILASQTEEALSDAQIGALLDEPIGSPLLEDIVKSGERVLFIVPDSSRRSGAGQVINLAVRRLIANGTMPYDLGVLFATGRKRAVTEPEKQDILTPFIAQRLVSFNHDHRGLTQLTTVGETMLGGRVTLNKAVTEYDHIVTIADIGFDMYSGFNGGFELICPGIASSETISIIDKVISEHHLPETRIFETAEAALNDDNPVYSATEEITAFIPATFAITTMVNCHGAVTNIICGDRKASFAAARKAYWTKHVLNVGEKREYVIGLGSTSSAEAVVGLSAASDLCLNGGTIFLLTDAIKELSVDKTFMTLLPEVLKRNKIVFVSDLAEADSIDLFETEYITIDTLKDRTAEGNGYIIPNGGKNLFKIDDD